MLIRFKFDMSRDRISARLKCFDYVKSIMTCVIFFCATFRYDNFNLHESRHKYNKSTSPVIRGYHVPQKYDIQPIRYLDQRLYDQHRHNNRRKQQPKSVFSKPGRNDVNVWDSSERRPLTTGIFRTYGKGQAKIPWMGASVHVPKTSGHKKVNFKKNICIL